MKHVGEQGSEIRKAAAALIENADIFSPEDGDYVEVDAEYLYRLRDAVYPKDTQCHCNDESDAPTCKTCRHSYCAVHDKYQNGRCIICNEPERLKRVYAMVERME